MSELLRHAMKSTKLASDAVRALERANARIVELEAENARLRKLDHEYGRVEGAIIMNDKDFDGNSAHDNCGDRLIASVVRLRTRAEAAEAKLATARNDALDEAAVVAWSETEDSDWNLWSEEGYTAAAETVSREINAAIRALKQNGAKP